MQLSDKAWVTANNTGTSEVVAAEEGRVYLCLAVPASSPEAVHFTLDGTTPGASKGIPMSPGAIGAVIGPDTPKGVIKAWSAGGTGVISCCTGVTTAKLSEAL